MHSLNNTYKIVSLALALLIFITSLGLSIDMHYCQGHLKSISFSGKAKSCYQLADVDSKQQCSAHQQIKITKKAEGCSLKQKDCCNNTLLQLLSDKDKEVQSNQLVVNRQLQNFVLAFITTFLSTEIIDTERRDFISYKPPIIQKDISVLFETYLL